MSKLAVLGGVSGLQAGGGWDDESMAWGMAGDMTMVDVTRDEKLSPSGLGHARGCRHFPRCWAM